MGLQQPPTGSQGRRQVSALGAHTHTHTHTTTTTPPSRMSMCLCRAVSRYSAFGQLDSPSGVRDAHTERERRRMSVCLSACRWMHQPGPSPPSPSSPPAPPAHEGNALAVSGSSVPQLPQSLEPSTPPPGATSSDTLRLRRAEGEREGEDTEDGHRQQQQQQQAPSRNSGGLFGWLFPTTSSSNRQTQQQQQQQRRKPHSSKRRRVVILEWLSWLDKRIKQAMQTRIVDTAFVQSMREPLPKHREGNGALMLVWKALFSYTLFYVAVAAALQFANGRTVLSALSVRRGHTQTPTHTRHISLCLSSVSLCVCVATNRVLPSSATG